MPPPAISQPASSEPPSFGRRRAAGAGPSEAGVGAAPAPTRPTGTPTWPAPRCLRDRRGSVIIVVLVLVFFAAYMLTRMVESGSVELLVEMQRADRERLRDDAFSALETTLAVLADFRALERRLYAPEQGWADPLAWAAYVPREGVTIEVKFEDESGKLSLPQMNRDQLVALFIGLGLLENDADKVADALFAWTHRDYTPTHYEVDSLEYETADLAYRPPYRSPRTFEELRAVTLLRDLAFDAEGGLTSFGQAFKDSVSLYAFTGSNLNANLANTLATAGMDEAQIDTAGQYRAGIGARAAGAPPYFRSLQEFRSVLGNAPAQGLDTEIKVLRIILTAREGSAQLTLNAVVCAPGVASLPESTKPEDPTNAGTGGQNQASQANQPATTGRAGTGSAANNSNASTTTSLNYPFTLLELTETTVQPPPPPPDALPSA